ncbi:hypothetical protein [Mesorhizobium sp. Z1-4]|uniref:hypothetical protein n=1 Tax=Mesorhizobium sp. Z1-4 TaxID=2448478 RepID=UPI000FDC9DE1|nr:hypothetical protein [Mesorhizobium sp. Z1-4]
MMEGAIEQERAALMRIITLLLALAGLAERAAARSPAMRGFVLWVLRRAEAVARDFVACGHDAPSMPPAGTRPADAMRLALSLRRLARQLKRQIKRQAKLLIAARSAGSAGTHARQPVPAIHDVAHALTMLMGLAWPIPAPDTS